MLKLALFIVTLLAGAAAQALAPVEAVALFKDRVVVRTAHGQEMIKLGETSAAGVTLLKADTSSARVRFRGETYDLSLSARVASNFVKPTHNTVHINRDEYGQYRMRGAVNGHFVNFLVDTGASVVAMSERHARVMGLDFRAGDAGVVQTAQGNTSAYFLMLDAVTLGGITLRGVQATVIEGDFPVDVLLGMSFLGKLGLNDNNGVLTLSAKY